MLDEKKKLTIIDKICYALGDFCFTFFIMFIGYYLMYFLTDVIRFDTVKAASIYSIVQVFETLGIIVGGIVIDRVHLKGGKYRPWMLGAAIFCAVMLNVLFNKYDVSIKQYTLLFPFLYFLCYWGYNFMWVGFRALPGLMAGEDKDVVDLAIASQAGAVTAALIYSVIGVKLLYGFGSIEKGYNMSSLVFGAVIIVCMTVVFFMAKPYDNDLTRNEKKREKVSLIDSLKAITGPMVPYFLANVLRSSVSVAIPALMVYYFSYVLNDPSGMTKYLSFTSIIQIAAVLLLKPLTMKFDKTHIYKGTAWFSIIVLVAAYFFGTDPTAFIVLMALNNLSIVISVGMNNAFITDIADYNEYVRGNHSRGFTISISGTANTVASLFGGIIGSFSLVLIGYDSSLQVQSAGLANGLRLIVTLGTALMIFISYIPFLFYKLDNKAMEEVYELKRKANIADQA